MRSWTALIVTTAASISIAHAQGTLSQGADQPTDESNAAESQSSRTGSPDTATGVTPNTPDAAAPSATRPVTTGRRDSSSNTDSDRRHSKQGATSTAQAGMNDPELASLTTEKFVHRAAASGMKELQAAEIALRNSTNEQVKGYARELIADHSKQNRQLTTLAAQNNIQVSKDLPSKDRDNLNKLRNQTGDEFDQAYMQQMVMDHQKAIALYQSCATAEQVNEQVRQFCSGQLPTLQAHQRDVRELDTTDRSQTAASDE